MVSENPAHVREWSFAEFHAYIARWFHIEHHFIFVPSPGDPMPIVYPVESAPEFRSSFPFTPPIRMLSTSSATRASIECLQLQTFEYYRRRRRLSLRRCGQSGGAGGRRGTRAHSRSGSAAARNAAAKNAAGDILIFMDADTSAHPDTLDRIAPKFKENPELDAVIGSYDQQPSAPRLVGRFREPPRTVLPSPGVALARPHSGCLRRSAQKPVPDLGRLGRAPFPRPSIEDVELVCVFDHAAVRFI